MIDVYGRSCFSGRDIYSLLRDIKAHDKLSHLEAEGEREPPHHIGSCQNASPGSLPAGQGPAAAAADTKGMRSIQKLELVWLEQLIFSTKINAVIFMLRIKKKKSRTDNKKKSDTILSQTAACSDSWIGIAGQMDTWSRCLHVEANTPGHSHAFTAGVTHPSGTLGTWLWLLCRH